MVRTGNLFRPERPLEKGAAMTDVVVTSACALAGPPDAAPHRDVDDLTGLAAMVCDAQIALVTLLDGDRLLFESHHGLDATETERDGTFCSWVVAHEQPLLVQDARLDPRFSDGAVVAGAPYVRSYAGVPLVVEDEVVGTLCVMDPRPGHLRQTQLEQLSMLGRQASGQLLLRRQAARLTREMAVREQVEADLREAVESVARSERRIRVLFDHSPIGLAECRSDGTFVDVNVTLCRMLGRERDELIGTRAGDLLADDEERDRQESDLASLDGRQSYFARRLYRQSDGGSLPVHVGVARVHGPEAHDGVEDRVIATVTDITDQVLGERRLKAAHEELRRRQIFTDAVLDSIDVGVVACDEAGRLTVFNRATQAWHGMGVDGAGAQDPENFATSFDLFDHDGSTVLSPDRVPLLRALRDGAVERAEIVIAPHDRPATRVECTGRSMIDEDGNLLGAVVAMNDITAARAQQAALLASETRSRAIFESDPAALVLFTLDGRVVQANSAVGDILGLTPQEVAAAETVDELLAPGDRDLVRGLVDLAHHDPGQAVTAERELRTRDGRTIWCLLTATDLPDPELGHCLLLQAEDVTLRREAERRLTHQALYDSLTDLPNRALLSERIRAAVARVQRRAEGCVYALFCDLDGFKDVNDTHGHAAGDHVLVEVGRRLSATVRTVDTVGRLGGDEFLVLCEEIATDEEVVRLATRLAQAVSQPVRWDGHELTVSMSVGISRADGTTSAEELVGRADSAMYRAKRLGKDRYVLDASRVRPSSVA